MYPRVKNVKAGKEYFIKIWFDNDEIKTFDLKPYLERGMFAELKKNGSI
jgi:hypothetical protein